MTRSSTEKFVRLLAQHDREIYRYIYTLIGDRADAEDVMQETAASLWRRFDQYDASQPFRPWAFRFAYFEVLAFRKRSRRQPMFNDDLLSRLAEQTASEQPMLEARREALDVCMMQLSESDRQLLQQRYAGDQTIADLARRVGRPAKKLYDALERIRRQLTDCVTRRLARGTGGDA